MTDENVKRPMSNANLAFKERFQFVLSINDNIICQRYFKILGFNKDSLTSVELKDVLDESVILIKQDLIAKSNAYTYYTTPSTEIKLTGFVEGEEPTYIYQAPVSEQERKEEEVLNPYDVTFKFEFIADEKPVYTQIWDGTVYPRYVRNGVDITNSNASYRNRDVDSLSFAVALIRHMTLGRPDLVKKIISNIHGVCSNSYVESNGEYTRTEKYGDTVYALNYEQQYIDSWYQYTKQKTKDYFYKNN